MKQNFSFSSEFRIYNVKVLTYKEFNPDLFDKLAAKVFSENCTC
jgi:hypothetical protein